MRKNPITILSAMALALVISSCGDSTKGIRLTDALDDSLWQSSEWISAANAPVVTETIKDGLRAADGASWFVSTIKNKKKIKEAIWMTAGLGTYDLYVNGQLIGDEFLKPGFTHHDKTKRSYTYDITDALSLASGKENTLSAEVTPGWWGDKIMTPSGYPGFIGKKPAFRAVLQITYTDGTKDVLGTDTEGWIAGIAGPVRHAAIFDGEVYDARVQPGFMTQGQLLKPEVNTEFQGEILPTNGAEIYLRHDLALKPIESYVWEDVTGASETEYGRIVVKRAYQQGEELAVYPGENLVVDFGQNCAGVPSFTFLAKEGTKLTFKVAELLNDGNGAKSRGMDGPEGSIHRTNLRIPETAFYLDYTFADSKQAVSYQPHHTFFGYRLASITATDTVRIQSLVTIPVTSIAEDLETGKITTGDESINKLISNTYWGQLSNYLSVPTDCPQRNERLGWTADTQVFTETGTFFANTDGFFHKWLRDMRDSQSELGGYPGVAPLAQYGMDMMRVGWADAGIIVPWTIWKQYGDKSIVDESWDSMEKYMKHIAETRYDHTAHVAENGNYQWADWLSYEPLESNSGTAFGPDGPLPEAIGYWNYLCASYWLLDASYMRDMAEATGRDARKYQEMTEEARAYIKEQFLTPEGDFKTAILNTMQTPALFALKNDIVEGEARERVITRLRENFRNHGNCLQTGFLGTSILMPTLTENGMSDIAYELLFQRKNPSWLYSVDNGATTIWERWNSYMKDSGMGPKGMNSFNHYAYGVVCQWIWENVAGIAADTKSPGFKHIIMKPVPDKRLGHIEAEYASASGLIKSAWHYQGDTWIWEFTIPEGTTATVVLPGESREELYQPGTYTIRK